MKSSQAGKGNLSEAKKAEIQARRDRVEKARRRAERKAANLVHTACANGMRITVDMTIRTNNFAIEGIRKTVAKEGQADV